MAKDFAKTFYNSKKWKKCREAYISSRILIDGGLCEVCRENTGYIVHHKTMLNSQNINNTDITLNFENLSYECKRCHDLEEGHWFDQNGIAKPNALFDSSGQPIDIRRI